MGLSEITTPKVRFNPKLNLIGLENYAGVLIYYLIDGKSITYLFPNMWDVDEWFFIGYL